MTLAVSIGSDTIAVYLDGEYYQVDKTHANYQDLLEQLRKPQRDLDAISKLLVLPDFVAAVTSGRVQVAENEVRFRGERVGGYMAERLVTMLRDKLEISSWAAFMDNLMDNPDPAVREDLYAWMEAGKMPITPDGCLLGFKKVRDDYTDVHTGRFSNKPGCTLEMPRSACDPSRNNTCSTGFHFCSAGYLSSFRGSRVVVVKINPSKVTAIPADYHNQKARCCEYTVLSELTKESAARHEAWSQHNVLSMEDPRELPDGLLVPRSPPTPAKITPEPGHTQPPPVDTMAPKAAPPAKAPKKAAAKGKPAAPAPKAAADFTSKGKTFTRDELKLTLAAQGSYARAARHLGVPVTTLKGWARKL